MQTRTKEEGSNRFDMRQQGQRVMVCTVEERQRHPRRCRWLSRAQKGMPLEASLRISESKKALELLQHMSERATVIQAHKGPLPNAIDPASLTTESEIPSQPRGESLTCASS